MYSEINENSYNVIISHSQGNLYANELCKYSQKQSNSKKILNIPVATPANQTLCNPSNTYTTLHRDLVIQSVRAMTSLTKELLLPNPLPSNTFLSNSFNCLGCHNLVDAYLSDTKPLNKIKKHFEETMEWINNDQKFPILSLEIKQITKDSSIMSNLKSKYDAFITNTDLSYRKTKANITLIKYISDSLGSEFAGSLLTLDLKNINSKKFKEFLDIELKVSSDEEYADFLGLLGEKFQESCGSSTLLNLVSDLCKELSGFEYYRSPAQAKEETDYLIGSTDNPTLGVKKKIELTCDKLCSKIQKKCFYLI